MTLIPGLPFNWPHSIMLINGCGGGAKPCILWACDMELILIGVFIV